MYTYIVKRMLMLFPTLFGAAVIIFLLLRLIPGDVCLLKFGGEGGYVDPEEIAQCQDLLGLSDPKIKQFYDYISGFVTFDLGKSMWTQQDVTHEIAIRFPLSLQIAIMATLVSVLIAVPLGVISAAKQNTLIDYFVRAISIAGIAMPSFWLGIVIILGLLIATQAWTGVPWMPPIFYKPIWVDPAHNLSQLIWPALATGYRYSSVATRMTRSAMLDVLREDYVRTARAKGLIERVIVNKHALKNAMLPVVTVIGIEFAFLMGGLVVTEQVFNLNGVGKLFVESVTQADYTLTQSLVMLVVFIYVVINFLVDLIRMLRRQPLGSAGALVIIIMAFAGLFAEQIAPFDPEMENFEYMLSPPGTLHEEAGKVFYFGTDSFGRDQLSRMIYGARTALLVGFTASFCGAFLGLVLGVASAYFGGAVDLVLQRVCDVFMAFPLIIMALAIVSIFGTGVEMVIIAITIPFIPNCAVLDYANSVCGSGDSYRGLTRLLRYGCAGANSSLGFNASRRGRRICRKCTMGSNLAGGSYHTRRVWFQFIW